MYKLFLTFRYLTRKAIVIFPILVVWLCVMMMIIVTSIMGGFVARVQQANRQLLGDIVIDNRSQAGWPYYEELQKELETLKDGQGRKLVLASTPVITSYGLLNLPDHRFNHPAQVIGIDPVGRAKVSGFRQTLFRQDAAPRQAVEDFVRFGLPATRDDLFHQANIEGARKDKEYNRVLTAWRQAVVGSSERASLEDQKDSAQVDLERAYRTSQLAARLPAPPRTFSTPEELLEVLLPKEPSFAIPPEAGAAATTGPAASEGGCIVGVDMGLSYRTRRGSYLRPMELEFIHAVVTVVPVSTRGTIVSQPQEATLVIVDDACSRVFDVDSTYVYAPFKKVQAMSFMSAWSDEGISYPARCSELDIKVVDGDDPLRLREAGDIIQAKLNAFMVTHQDLGSFHPRVQTWEEKQARYVKAVQNEKYMQIFILGLMSLVVLVVIFLIFWMIVRDKTKDIGIIKAVGGSEEGVAGIFVIYGATIGVVGGLLGVYSGVLFVTHTNQIHEWIYNLTGLMIWDRSVYMFDRIPDTVSPREVVMYFAAAVIAGMLGALIPALVAGSRNPVEAVRYE